MLGRWSKRVLGHPPPENQSLQGQSCQDPFMTLISALAKIFFSGLIVFTASEVAEKSTLMGALIVSIPFTSILALWFLYADTNDTAQVAEMAQNILWLVLPSVALFVLLPVLLNRGWDFVPAMSVGVVATVVAYLAFLALANQVGSTS